MPKLDKPKVNLNDNTVTVEDTALLPADTLAPIANVEDLLSLIADYLSLQDLGRVMQSSKKFKEIILFYKHDYLKSEYYKIWAPFEAEQHRFFQSRNAIIKSIITYPPLFICFLLSSVVIMNYSLLGGEPEVYWQNACLFLLIVTFSGAGYMECKPLIDQYFELTPPQLPENGKKSLRYDTRGEITSNFVFFNPKKTTDTSFISLERNDPSLN